MVAKVAFSKFVKKPYYSPTYWLRVHTNVIETFFSLNEVAEGESRYLGERPYYSPKDSLICIK